MNKEKFLIEGEFIGENKFLIEGEFIGENKFLNQTSLIESKEKTLIFAATEKSGLCESGGKSLK
ncbi:MAG: hypothetical protein IKV87_05250 [Methanobrevibacter sp.]|nr:hypothetical protein [Methanobrevibacter sp.]